MNDTLNLLYSHRSERDYTDEAVSEEMLGAIVEAAYRAPTSVNAQHVSLVVVRDQAHRARIAEIAGGQPWIARAPVFITVLLDFNKTKLAVEAAGKVLAIQESLEGFAAATIDAGIALSSLMIAARSLGLGVVPIGGIRRNSPALIDLLELPRLTFPIVGVAIGHVRHAAAIKPRLPLETFRHDERYDSTGFADAFARYDAELLAHWQAIGRADGLAWTENTASHYAAGAPIRPTLADAARQGLVNNK